MAAAAVALVACQDGDTVIELLTALEAELGEVLSAFEVMSANALEAVFAHQPNLRRPFGQLPRYAALALRHNRSERAPVRIGQGADLFNRTAWTLIFGAIGAFVVWAPFIPIWEKWIPFAGALCALVFAPALPDLHRRLLLRRHEVALLALLLDMDAAGRALPEPEDAAPLALPAAEQRAKLAQPTPPRGVVAPEKS